MLRKLTYEPEENGAEGEAMYQVVSGWCTPCQANPSFSLAGWEFQVVRIDSPLCCCVQTLPNIAKGGCLSYSPNQWNVIIYDHIKFGQYGVYLVPVLLKQYFKPDWISVFSSVTPNADDARLPQGCGLLWGSDINVCESIGKLYIYNVLLLLLYYYGYCYWIML